ncbi:Retrovirus-related Pol polyprotein from transposon RE1 [Vitis vinifera]|uniref:Retrovirus-related Pol polyprotein from transposon RE1 n=1 Tax=Vitis vinifera TaxID=29760 RepID=A0A438HGM0_VITVI|nr:Retrovirus-related Pol polyprotein from transposon RE1 [Vitis vinifera]
MTRKTMRNRGFEPWIFRSCLGYHHFVINDNNHDQRKKDSKKTSTATVAEIKTEANVAEKASALVAATDYGVQCKGSVLRSDNGGEYQSSDLQKYLEGHDIIHQTTCSNTPQQNGVAERKNRHLLEVVRASLIAAKISISYWGEAITSAAYLINRGYRCYHPPTRRMFITMDVVFHEDSMYFSSESELQGDEPGSGELDMSGTTLEPSSNDHPKAEEVIEEGKTIQLNHLNNLGPKMPSLKYQTNSSVEGVLNLEPDPFMKRLPHRHNRGSLSYPRWKAAMNEEMKSLMHGVRKAMSEGVQIEEVIVWVEAIPRAWFGRFTKSMRAFGYHQSNSYHTLFLKKQHVSRSSKGIFLSQRKYALDLLQETGMSRCQPVNTPIEEGLKLCVEPNQVSIDKGRYQRLVGRLMYLAHTRPDLTYALNLVSQYMHNPGEQHMNAVMRILRYLKNAPGKGILFAKNVDHQSIEVYTDADWAGAMDDRRSTSGYFTFVGGNLVTWKSKKQNVVACSSAETEFRGMTLGLCEALWLRLLSQDLGYLSRQPIRLFCDNKAACDIAHNPVQHDHTKHVEVDRFFIKEKLDDKIVELPKIRSEDQLADILTKVVSSQVFSKFLDKLGMCDIYAPT